MSGDELLADIHAQLRAINERSIAVAGDIAAIKQVIHSPDDCPGLARIDKRLEGLVKRVNLFRTGGVRKRTLASIAAGAAVVVTTVLEVLARVWPVAAK